MHRIGPGSNSDYYSAFEVCYKGVTYVRFAYSNMAWGGAMVDAEGKPVPCSNELVYGKGRPEFQPDNRR